LRCPFGCRRQHRRQASNGRSAAYRQTPTGKRRKKFLNARRQRGPGSADRRQQPDTQPQEAPPREPTADTTLPVTVELRLEGVVLDELRVATSPMLPYVRMLLSLIEGMELTCREVAELLCLAMRQHSIGDPGGAGYASCFPPQRPP
jgi:hypothetical protein